jgi:putative transposase
LTIEQQYELLGLPRSTYYYQPRPKSAENLRLMWRLDELYMECPFFGSRRMALTLGVNRKRIQRLMGILGFFEAPLSFPRNPYDALRPFWHRRILRRRAHRQNATSPAPPRNFAF